MKVWLPVNESEFMSNLRINLFTFTPEHIVLCIYLNMKWLISSFLEGTKLWYNFIYLDAKKKNCYFHYSTLTSLVKFKYFLSQEIIKIVDISDQENICLPLSSWYTDMNIFYLLFHNYMNTHTNKIGINKIHTNIYTEISAS